VRRPDFAFFGKCLADVGKVQIVKEVNAQPVNIPNRMNAYVNGMASTLEACRLILPFPALISPLASYHAVLRDFFREQPP
jgi:hypothetical protein